MSNHTDQLLDRIRLKKKLNLWRLGAFGVALVLLLMVSNQHSGGSSPIESPFIARITVDGFVMDDPTRDEALEEALENKNIRAVVVQIDTPGGAVVGGEETFYKLREIAKTKPVVSVMRGMATSAGYMIAIGGDYIVAREGTLTGSIGVILETAEFTQLAEKLGVTPITIKSTPLKGSPGMFEKNTPEAEAALKEVIADTYQMFVEMVADRRGYSPEEVAEVADGRVFTGRQALKLKLIDAIGGENEAIEWLENKKGIQANLQVKDIDKKNDKIESLKDFLGSTARRMLGLSERTSALDGILSVWHPIM